MIGDPPVRSSWQYISLSEAGGVGARWRHRCSGLSLGSLDEAHSQRGAVQFTSPLGQSDEREEAAFPGDPVVPPGYRPAMDEGDAGRMAELLHFTASWAEPICADHRHQVAQAATELGLAVREVDIDQEPDLVREYHIQNVPAVAITGDTGSVILGARPSGELVRLLRQHPTPFKAIVWLLNEPDKPQQRREFMAHDYDHAKSILHDEFGENIDFVLTAEEAARRSRGQDPRPGYRLGPHDGGERDA